MMAMKRVQAPPMQGLCKVSMVNSICSFQPMSQQTALPQSYCCD